MVVEFLRMNHYQTIGQMWLGNANDNMGILEAQPDFFSVFMGKKECFCFVLVTSHWLVFRSPNSPFRWDASKLLDSENSKIDPEFLLLGWPEHLKKSPTFNWDFSIDQKKSETQEVYHRPLLFLVDPEEMFREAGTLYREQGARVRDFLPAWKRKSIYKPAVFGSQCSMFRWMDQYWFLFPTPLTRSSFFIDTER